MTLPPITNRYPALRFNQPWQLLRPTMSKDPESSIHFDENLLQKVGSSELPPTLCLKQDPQCLVVTRREARMEGFERACEILKREGWPVVVRASGGSCVPQGLGMLNLSIIHPRINGWNLDDGYLLLCDLLARLLTSYGIEAETGEVPGSFCDGRYNLQIGGKKLVGTAQRWAGGNRHQAAILAHACLLVDLDLSEVTGRVNQLYRLCHTPLQFDPLACTTLRDSLPEPSTLDRNDFVAGVERRLAIQLSEDFAI